jgi:hypothetical protein
MGRKNDHITALAKVSGYCRVRSYDGCATQHEIDVGRKLRLGRPATPDECFNHLMESLRFTLNYGFGRKA